jgi:Holliday junction resolvasome RuvABC ATP-dependent DNA helicase subunit
MADWMKANPGLERRFPDAYRFTLPDYGDEELAEIFRRMAADRRLVIAPDAEPALRVACRRLRARATKRFGNAGEVRNLVDRVERAWATRAQRTGDPGAPLAAADFGDDALESGPSADEALRALHAELETFVGLAEVREALTRLAAVIGFEQEEQLAGRGTGAPVVHWLFGGNPGTGKTVVARLMGRFFHAMGLLPTDRVLEVDAKELVGQYIGETKQKTAAVIDRAMGGVLFVDEAHQLAPPQDGRAWSFNKEAVDVLLKRMEDDRGKFVVIAAGYPGHLERFLDADPGLRSRFTRRLDFADYSADELLEILRREAARARLAMADGTEARLRARCAEAIAARGDQYGNGRFARKLLDATVENQRVRLSRVRETRALDDADRTLLLPNDVPDSALPLV